MALDSLRKLFGPRNKPKRRPVPRSRLNLAVELLENRLVPATLHVGSGAHDFHHIQDAVLAASPGDTIKVDPGTYQEQVTIGKNSKGVLLNNLQLDGAGLFSVIKAPATMASPFAIVEVAGAHNVTIQDFTIKGPGSGNAADLYGIRVDGGGSAAIKENHITQIEDSKLSGVQRGVAILVGRDNPQAKDVTTGTATISFNLIDNYQKGGIVAANTGSSATIDHNVVLGVGPTKLIAQNGIQIGDGATGTISHNVVAGNVYTGAVGAASGGILLSSPGLVTVDHNEVYGNDIGIWAVGATGVVITHNEVSRSTLSGIVLDTTSGAQVSHNELENSKGDGIELFGATKNTIDHNESDHNKSDGIFVDSASTGNTFTNNELQANGNLDAEDQSTGTGTAGTGNTWSKNEGKTSNPKGLFK